MLCTYIYMQLRYHIAKNFGSKKVWRIRTAGSFTENNYGELKIHFHWECYGNSKINKKHSNTVNVFTIQYVNR